MYLRWFLGLALCVLRIWAADPGQVYLLSSVGKCKPSEYFDVEHLQCRLCDPASGLMAASDYQSCLCDPDNSTTAIEYDNLARQPICDTKNKSPPQPTIENCKFKMLNLTTSSSASITHVQILSPIPQTNCTCSSKTHSLAEYRDQSFCIPRQLINDYLPYAAFAIDKWSDRDGAVAELSTVSFFCRTMRDLRACNHLANLCVLHRYQRTPRHSPCSLFAVDQRSALMALTKDSRPDEDDFNMNQAVRYPRVFTADVGKDTVALLDTKVGHEYSRRVGDETHLVQLQQVRYALDGALVKMQPLILSDLNPCATLDQETIRFGVNMLSSCHLHIDQLLRHFNREDGEFLELYLQYKEEKTELMRHIPILVRDADIFTYNAGLNRDKWQLVGRFAPIDTRTDRNPKFVQLDPFANTDRLQAFKSIRYAKRLELQIPVDANHKACPNRIHSPMLVVEYAMLNTTKLLSSDDAAFVDFTFAVTFTKDAAHFAQILEIAVYVAVALATCNTIRESYRNKMRQQRQFFDVPQLMHAIGFMGENLTIDVIWAVIGVLWFYVWLEDDSRDAVKLLLPAAKQLRTIRWIILVSVPVKAALLLLQLRRLCCTDVFFVDWERPRTGDCHSGHSQLHQHLQQQQGYGKSHGLDTPSISSVGQQTIATTMGGGGQPIEAASAWRTYFVAQEWLRITMARQFSVAAQFVLVVGILYALAPVGDGMLILAKCSAVYVGAYVGQRALFWLAGQRAIAIGPGAGARRFVELCSLANVSVFVLSMDTFGYYVHGRSPNGFADIDAASMLQQLRRDRGQMELGGARSHRGLLLSSEQQTFAFLVPANLRLLYDRLIAPIRAVAESGAGDEPASSKFFAANMEKTASAHHNLNKFLAAFIEHGLKDLDYTIQNRTLVQRLLDIENREDCTETRGVFYADSGHSFDSIMLGGNEQLLFHMELMLFMLVVCLTANGYLAMLAVGCWHLLINFAMARLTRRNLCRQTLVDPRFML